MRLGFKMCCPDDTYMGRILARAREWQRPLTDVLLGLLTPDHVFVDVGAGLGYYSLLAAALGCRAVYAIDPDPDHCAAIRQSIVANGFGSIELIEAAASDTTEPLTLWLNPGNDGDSRLDSHHDDAKPITVNAVRLDDHLPMIRPAVVKMDVQGHEPRALAGAAGFLRRVRPVLIVEESAGHLTKAGWPPGILRTMLDDYGYTVDAIMANGKATKDLLAKPKG